MNPRKNHLLVAGPGQRLNFSQDIPDFPGTDSSPGIRDDAVTAELVTAVLYLNKGPGTLSRPLHLHLLIMTGMADIQHMRISMPLTSKLLKNLCQLPLLIVSNQNIHRRIRFQLLGSHLNIAASGHYNRLRIQLFRAVKHLA